MNPLKLITIVSAIVFCGGTALFGASTVKPKATPVHHHTVIQTVSADSITISQAGGDKTFKITKNTEILFKNETTTADKLQAGMRVQVTPDSADPTVAGQISANDPPKDPSTPAPKK
jgi:hypothetical protein